MKNHIKEMLEQRKMSVNEFVEKAGISRSLGSSLLNAETIPEKTRFDTIQGILSALQCKFSDIAEPEINARIIQAASLDNTVKLKSEFTSKLPSLPQDILDETDHTSSNNHPIEHRSLAELEITVENLKYTLALLIDNTVPTTKPQEAFESDPFAYEPNSHYSNYVTIVQIDDAERLSDLNSNIKPFNKHNITDTSVLELITYDRTIRLAATQALMDNFLLYFPDDQIGDLDATIMWGSYNTLDGTVLSYATRDKDGKLVAFSKPLKFSDKAQTLHLETLAYQIHRQLKND